MPSAAPGPVVCLPTPPSDSTGGPQDPVRTGGSSPGRPALATATMVRRPNGPLNFQTMEDPSGSGLTEPGGHPAPRTTVVATDRLACERVLLRERSSPPCRLPAARPLTEFTMLPGGPFVCGARSPILIQHLLRFQRFLNFSKTTLTRASRQILSNTRWPLSTPSFQGPQTNLSAATPGLRLFLEALLTFAPPVVHWYPTWDLSLVLQVPTI